MPLIVTPWQLKRRAEFYRELASLTAAGIPLLRGLQEVLRRPPGRSYRRPVERILSRISAGNTLTDALRGEGAWLDAFDLALIQASEQSGRLVECFRALSNHYAERARVIETLLLQLAYPTFLFHFAVIVFPPHLLGPLIWKGQVGPFLRQKISLLAPIYAVVFLLLLVCQSRHGEWWRSILETVTRLIPWLRTARRSHALASLAASLEGLVSAGVTIIEAWELAAAACGSPAIRRTVESWKPRLLAGELPSELVGSSRQFPDLFANLYHTGEVSGELDEQLRHLHQYYQDSAARNMRMFIGVLATVIFLGVALLVAWWVITFYVNLNHL